uniref:Putative secreted peptide n=1 Tax=Anopheles braziliensis TaxID=58242 RepID=A0A2M3ZRV4_9DIPT
MGLVPSSWNHCADCSAVAVEAIVAVAAAAVAARCDSSGSRFRCTARMPYPPRCSFPVAGFVGRIEIS